MGTAGGRTEWLRGSGECELGRYSELLLVVLNSAGTENETNRFAFCRENEGRLIAFVSVRLVRILYEAEHVSGVHPPV